MQYSQLYNQITNSCIDYLALSPLGENHARVQFTGQFEQQPVVWEATIIGLSVPAQAPMGSTKQSRANDKATQYIEITHVSRGSPIRQVEIGLLVAVIDEATVLKTMIMLRQYKNLRNGRYSFQGLHK